MGYSCSSVVSSPDMILALNSWSVTWSGRLQTVLSVVKLLALALIIVPGMMLLAQGRCAAVWLREGARHACLTWFYQSLVTRYYSFSWQELSLPVCWV